MPRDLFAQPLFSPKLIQSRFPPQPIPDAHWQAIAQWAQQLKGGLGQVKEEALRTSFLRLFFTDILGYAGVGSTATGVWTLDLETQASRGAVDACLGTFTHGQRQIVAPFELKGPKTTNLEALMPGRHKSPVQQAWEYACDLPGSQFVLVSNCDEIRLYALGYGRAVYESWTAAELLEPARYASFVGLLKADHLLSNATQNLLKANALAEKAITLALYTDYKTLRQELILGLHHLNPGIAFAALVGHAQKLIDRLLFIAFAESRALLPQGSIQRAASEVNPYQPQPLWGNFVGLFKAVNTGNEHLKIKAYNGGLFAPDAAMDGLTVSDKLVKSFLKLAGYDYANEVSVTVLGRIFEQSISDLERIASAGDVAQFALGSSSNNASASAAAAAKVGSVDGKRKRDGVVYTPDHITRFIVEQTVSPVLRERFAAVQKQHQTADGQWRKPGKAQIAHAPPSVLPAHIGEYGFWLAWQSELGRIRVCDPACGSGAFLVAAFDLLKEAYTQLHLKLRELAPSELFVVDISGQILSSNLYGVDINAESIEITKLSLWLKTAELGRKLAGLEANFYQGNSLVADRAVDALAFDWPGRFGSFDSVGSVDSPDNPDSAAINSIAARAGIHWAGALNDAQKEPFSADFAADFANFNGFDVVLGNPPYVRQELFSDLKPYLAGHYSAYHGAADLYVYFYELGLRLLKPGGRLGYISSSSFFKTSSGALLRRLLTTACQLEVLVDFGDWQVFDGVTTYPAVITAQKVMPDRLKPARFLQLTGAVPDLSAFFEENGQTLDLAQLQPLAIASVAGGLAAMPGAGAGEGGSSNSNSNSAVNSNSSAITVTATATATATATPLVVPEWQLEGAPAAALRSKLSRGHPTLKQAVGSPLYGVKTGLNEAFVIDRATRDRLVFADAASEPLFKPFLKGDDVERWRLESQDLWLILLPKGWTRQAMHVQPAADEAQAWAWFAVRHPSLAAHLLPFVEPARKRTDQGDYWWELRACAYYGKFEQPKIIYPDIAQGSKFCFDEAGAFFGNTAYFVPDSFQWHAAVLNSKAVWFYLQGVCEALRGGQWRLRMFTQHIETLPIPATTPAQQTELGDLAKAATQAASERLGVQRKVARRIYDLLPSPPPKGAHTTLGEALGNWWLLPDFNAFQSEVTKRFKADIALKDRGDWQDFIASERNRIHQLSANLAAIERAIDTAVYALFNLDAAEIALIERAVQR